MTDIITLENLVTFFAVFFLGFIFGMLINQLCKDLDCNYPEVPDSSDDHEDRRHERDCQ